MVSDRGKLHIGDFITIAHKAQLSVDVAGAESPRRCLHSGRWTENTFHRRVSEKRLLGVGEATRHAHRAYESEATCCRSNNHSSANKVIQPAARIAIFNSRISH